MKGLATSKRVPEPGIRALFTMDAIYQSWLDVEAALARAQATVGMIPAAAAEQICAAARLELIDMKTVEAGLLRTGHQLVPLVWELSRVCGGDAGKYVHWGATTQNILDTAASLQLRQANRIYIAQLARILDDLAALADRTADMPAAGRTHGQHAVPITFGFKIAVWIDELARHAERLRDVERRAFVAMLGGAAGTFASFGADGIALQAEFARELGLRPMPIPARTVHDHSAEYVCYLGLLTATCGKIGHEVYTLMKQEFAEASEAVPEGTVGSSTMPQKRNPILSRDIMAGASEVRALVPLALESMQTEHEANATTSTMIRNALERVCEWTGDILERVAMIAAGLTVDPERMRRNLDLTGGLILAEAIMLRLGEDIGRQEAHDVVYDATEAAMKTGISFAEALAKNEHVRAHLSEADIAGLLDPAAYTGLCAKLARDQADHGRRAAAELKSWLQANAA